ncbi:SWIM zinc finger family protein [Nocardioides anomalus]|uniref:SWIM zinc finger family protein n=1 Tax=Nocardioides anomalus TaxID=2712223 RepID=A0A6G6WII5_9ACTN|nr:SWIM zinc finger family protein [Nocardioides anomalus]QIG45016.1 SWIM zinc finger family protein [Nocardioides anomalus]
MPRWNLASVEKAAPDAASLKAAHRLAVPGPWSDTGSSETLVWGKCQGSGRQPYQVSIDLTGPAYRCSCPSRKFPCKHALALLLRWVSGHGEIGAGDPPPFAEPAAERPARTTKPVDPEARARRQAERFALMSAGIGDFSLWLADLVRSGTVQARRQPWGWWDSAAARLVDAQLPGLADRVRTMGSEVSRREDWADHLLSELGRWWSAVRSWERWDDLDERTRADLRAYVGWPQASEDVRAGETLTDAWLVLGAHRTDDGRLLQQRTWLRGEASGEVVQLLDFAAGGNPLPIAHLAGSTLEATLALYPGSRPRRALVVDEPVVRETPAALPAGGSLADGLDALAATVADNAWGGRVPVVLEAAVLPGQVVDAAGAAVPLLADATPWAALALTGGRPTTLVGELERTGFRVLSVGTDTGLVAV